MTFSKFSQGGILVAIKQKPWHCGQGFVVRSPVNGLDGLATAPLFTAGYRANTEFIGPHGRRLLSLLDPGVDRDYPAVKPDGDYANYAVNNTIAGKISYVNQKDQCDLVWFFI